MFKAAKAAIRGKFSVPRQRVVQAFAFLGGASGGYDKQIRPRWSRDEEIYLSRSYPKGTDVGFIAGLIGRPISAVRRKALRLGVHRPRSGRAAKAANALNAPPPPRTFLS
ncbi:hypothetical protein [Acetobacter lambici]|uniref:Uncharacterized protein n=1 Tax=Acetobacter lambici TaxID=1332824 RepID=A0ABT1F480_9PROT|nr:hypothetical protein [Acetobacter lambici]MCP1258943.1 hypothetical protein [Acetobacter lambici]